MRFPKIRSLFNFGFEPGSIQSILANSAAMTVISAGLIVAGVALGGAPLLGLAALEAGATTTVASGFGAALLGAGILSTLYELAYLGAAGNDYVQVRRTLKDAQAQVDQAQAQVNDLRKSLYKARAAEREGVPVSPPAAAAVPSGAKLAALSELPLTQVNARTAEMSNMLAAYQQNQLG